MPLAEKSASEENGGVAAARKSRTEHVVHLTHNDLDAVGADAIHRMRYGKGNVFTIWSSVGKFAALFSLVASCEGKGDLLSISDLGYFKEAEKIAGSAKTHGWKVEWRDHHRWRDDEITKVARNVALLRIDTTVCACGIVARDLAPENPAAAEIARVVCDYDLWKHTDPRSAVLGQVLQRKKNREHVRDCLVAGIFSDTLIEVIIGKDGKFSLRSVPPISHLIAREFGGGGHPNAAGGSFNFSVIERFTWWLFKKSRHFTEFVRIADSYQVTDSVSQSPA